LTALNIAIRGDLVAIAVDSILCGTDGRPAGHASKLTPIAHASVVIASSGAAGIGRDLAVAALAGVLGDDLVEVLRYAPDWLRAQWAGRDWRYASRAVVAGRSGRTTVAAYALESPHFEPRLLPAGVHLSPPIGARPAPRGALLPALSRDLVVDPSPLQTPSVPCAARVWRDDLAAIVDAVPRQQREGATLVGGRVVRAMVSPDGLDVRVVGNLPDALP
jgi:hypothetical protein